MYDLLVVGLWCWLGVISLEAVRWDFRSFEVSEYFRDDFRAEDFLVDEELVRMARFAKEDDRKRFVLGRVELRRELGDRLGMAPKEVIFERGRYGKLRVSEKRVHFNVSHAGNWVVLVFGENAVGVDIEVLDRRVRDLDAVADLFCDEEREFVMGSGEDGRRERFLRVWTAKEAYMKAVGMGLSLPLRDFAVVDEIGKSLVREVRDRKRRGQWELEFFELNGGSFGAICGVV